MKKTNLLEKLNKAVYGLFIAAAVSFTMTSCDDSEGDDPTPDPDPDPVTSSILDVVYESESHTQLETYLKANTNLTTALEGSDLTLFAPDDAAFEKLRATLGVESLTQVNPEVISAVLAFHVHDAVVLREDMNSSTSLSTAQGENITFNANGRIATGGSNSDVQFVGDEILATNGVVHVVNTILIPPMLFSSIAANLGQVSQPVLLGADFTHLNAAIQYADSLPDLAMEDKLVSILSDQTASLTVFAPVNGVFEAAAAANSVTVEQFITSFDQTTMRSIILHHVVAQDDLGPTELTADAPGFTTFQSALGLNLNFIQGEAGSGDYTDIFIDSNGDFTGTNPDAIDAEIAVAGAYDANNGIVHAIAGLLVPAM